MCFAILHPITSTCGLRRAGAGDCEALREVVSTNGYANQMLSWLLYPINKILTNVNLFNKIEYTLIPLDSKDSVGPGYA